MKYAINRCNGGFELSEKANKWLADVKGWEFAKIHRLKFSYDLELRCDKDVIECVKLMGEEANGEYSRIKLVECPLGPHDGIEIEEYEGMEAIPTKWV